MITTQKEYFTNVIGLTNLATWLSRWYKFEKSFKITESSIFVDGILSARFILGVPKSKKFGTNVFLAIQPEELLWFKNITWSHLAVDYSNNRLHIVSKNIPGCNDKTETLPSFSISILFDSIDKLKFLSEQSEIDIRQIWYEDDGTTEHISRNSSLLSLPVKILLENEPVVTFIESSKTNNYESLMAKKISIQNKYNK